MSKTADQLLAEYKESDYTVKLCHGMFSVIPFAPSFVFYNNLEGALQRVSTGASADMIQKTRSIALSEDSNKAIWVTEALDTVDKGLGIYTGLKNVFSMFSGSSPAKHTFEGDPQQAADAGAKALGLAYMIYKIFPGDVTSKVKQFMELNAGKEAALYFVTAEVGLPFADNLAESGGDLLSRIMNKHSADISSRFAQFAGQTQLQEASGVLQSLIAPLDGYVSQIKSHIGPITGKIKSFLPSAGTVMNVADSATGALATGVDLLPVWGFLGARLVAEAAAQRAVSGN